jgi:outer membrane protein
MIRPLALVAFSVTLAAAAVAQDPAPGGRLTADEAVALALKNSPTLEVARREMNVDLLEADRARPAFRPEVSATASQTFRTPRVDLPGRPDEVVLPNSISRFEINVRQPLYQFGAGKAPAKRAGAMAAAARSEFRSAELDTALEAREAYLNVVRAEAMTETARQGLELARSNIKLTELLIERGFQAEVDLLGARRGEAEAESGVVQAESGVALAKANLNRVLGRSLETEVAVDAGGPLPEEPGTLAELTERAVAARPEIQMLRHNMAAAEAGIRLAKASRLPRVSLEAAYALQTETALVPRSGLAGGVSITAPIFNGPIDRYTVRQAEERLEQLRGALKAREQGIALEIERQRLAMREARARIVLAEREIAAAEKAYEIKVLSLERGRSIQDEVAKARLDLTKARSNRAAAENDLRLARVRLDRALGEGAPAPQVNP